MNRREFLASSAAATVLSAGSPPVAEGASAKRALMKLGCQSAPSDEKHFQYFARYGVRNVCAYPKIADGRLYATVDELKSLRDLGDRHKISIDCIAPPFLESSHIDREKHPAIMLAESPERDRDIEALQTLIRNCAAAGIPSIKYNMSILGVLRTGRSPGRGDATYSTWRLR
jgi:mannonate dehydratase